MTNLIQIKRTSSSIPPTSLNPGEQAWINGSKQLVIGGTDNIIYPIGGEGFLNLTPINELAPATGAINANNQKITNLPTTNLSDTDAASVKYVKNLLLGLDAKNSVRCATTANVNLTSPGATLDGYIFSLGDRFLVKNQTDAKENGIYVWIGAGVAAVRADDFSFSLNTVSSRAFTYIENGTANKGSGWACSNSDPILETDAIFWVQFFGGGGNFTTSPPLYLDGSTIKLAMSSSLLSLDGNNSLIIAGGTAGQVLISNGTNAASFGNLNLSSVAGVLPISKGGTNVSSLDPGLLKTDGTSFLIAEPDEDYLDKDSLIDCGTF